MVFNGQLYRGFGGGAGEFGHTILDPEGPLCECGQRGCLETYVSDPALLRAAQQAWKDGQLPHCSDMVELINLAEQGNPAARRILAQAGETLGLAVANLVNLTNPQYVLVSGEGVRSGEWLLDPMRTTIRQNAQPPLLADLELCIEPWGDEMWARGAASLVLRELFEPPVLFTPGLNVL
jgi:predicted NBD/HSP70 family sugar kinase